MRTKLFKLNSGRPSRRAISAAARVIKRGGLVAFPTETVYGLGASAFNARAVRRIFHAKGRPMDNPLIVHISSISSLRRVVRKIPSDARKIMEKFWPGPLTLVFEKSPLVPDEVTAGLRSVGVRMPANKVALTLIRAAGPIAAPSANLSGRPSPTNAKDVMQDLRGKVDVVLDAGPSR
ncbi:MAG: L-threonylcarbamoyladenylate synthase, partial [Candidatus Micrarchaeia archaeon]